MAPQGSDSRHEFVDKRSEILSDATDLDVLLAALLDDQAAPTAITPWRRAAIEAQRDPPLVAPTPVDFSADRVLEPLIVPVAEDEKTDAFATFQAESDENSDENIVSPVPSRGRGNTVLGPVVKELLLLTGLAVAVLAIGAVYFRSDIVAAPSPATTAPAPVPAAAPVVPEAAPVEPPATMSTPAVIDDAPPRQPTAKARVTTKPLRQSASDRANPVRREVPPAGLASSSRASVGAASAVPQPVAARAGEKAPAPAALPNAEPPKPAAVTPTVVAGPVEPVATAPSPVPARVAKPTPARLLTGGPPVYPDEMRTARVGGTVEVRFTIDSRGRVSNVRSVTGPPQLRSVAEAAVRRWRYEPAQIGNVAIESERSVNFNFDPSVRRPQQ